MPAPAGGLKPKHEKSLDKYLNLVNDYLTGLLIPAARVTSSLVEEKL